MSEEPHGEPYKLGSEDDPLRGEPQEKVYVAKVSSDDASRFGCALGLVLLTGLLTGTTFCALVGSFIGTRATGYAFTLCFIAFLAAVMVAVINIGRSKESDRGRR